MLAVPMVWTLIILSKQTIVTRQARLPLGMILALLLFSFGENMEVQLYILWPAHMEVQLYILWPALVLIGASVSQRGVSESRNKAPTAPEPREHWELTRSRRSGSHA